MHSNKECVFADGRMTTTAVMTIVTTADSNY